MSAIICPSDYDPLWSNVEFLCGCEEANGSSTFHDESSKNRAIISGTSPNFVTATTSTPLAGKASASFPGNNNAYLSIVGATAVSLGGGSRTYELRAKPSSLASTQFLLGKRPVGQTNEFTAQINTNGSVQFYSYRTSTTPVMSIVSATGIIVANTAYRFAFCRDASTGMNYIFVDGVLVASGHETAVPNVVTSEPLKFGKDAAVTGRFFTGLMDEIRVTSACRYAATYTPSSDPFPRA